MKLTAADLVGIALSVSMTMAVFGSKPALALSERDVAAHCDKAAVTAANATGVPVDVLKAISRIETGRQVDGVLVPWPWAVNQAGEGSFFDSARQAMDHVANAMSNGESNIDVGCFQINLRWHGDSFASLGNMFEPSANALYAARFLLRLYGEFGNWEGAIGAYHSRKPDAAAGYLAKVTRLLNTAERPADRAVALAQGLPTNRFPLLRPGESRGYGSLVTTAFNDRAMPLLR
ncbi:MAG: lytic transglycosylase domain-containing protein [Paracoccaceae bacterium]